MAHPHAISWGFYTPARIVVVFGGRQYAYMNNSDEARHNLYWVGLDWW